MDKQRWLEARQHSPETLKLARLVLEDLHAGRSLAAALRQHPLPEGGHLAKHALVAAYRGQSFVWRSTPYGS